MPPFPADFAPFYGHATVMGMESQPDLTQELPTGICNAVILSQPYSPFIVSDRADTFALHRFSYIQCADILEMPFLAAVPLARLVRRL